MENESNTADREMTISRLLNAKRELVWQALSDANRLAQWWGPSGFSITSESFEFGEGGHWIFMMHGPDGQDYPNHIRYTKVVAPERLEYSNTGDDTQAERSFSSTITLEEVGEKTRFRLHVVLSSPEELERVVKEHGAIEGGIQTVGRMAEFLQAQNDKAQESITMAIASPREVVLQRVFDAPKALVFKAFTKAEYFAAWFGCRDFEVLDCAIDFRVGGEWRIKQRGPDGVVHPFKGEYSAITENELIAQSFIYDVEGIRDLPAHEEITFVQHEGKTILTNRIKHPNQEARDGHLNSGMEGGANESMNRLAELLTELT